MQRSVKRTLPVKPTDIYNGGTTHVHTGGATHVHIDIPLSDLADFQEVLAWWRKRKHLLTKAHASPAPTERWTLHIAKPFIEKIKAEAEAEPVTVTEVIHRIIRHDYAGSSTSTSGEQVRFS
jgi:hypothetical protein